MKLTVMQTHFVFIFFMLLALTPFLSPAVALLLGMGLSLLGIKDAFFTKYTSFMLKLSIVLMGFGMHLQRVISASVSGFFHTAISVVFVLSVGFLLTKLFEIDSKTGTLISVGTAICGGSAIAAISPVIGAKHHQISFSLVVVFVLNALALFIFPPIGHYFHLSQETFGNWAAIAIHDTSSVVGAGEIYGHKALEIATTVKLIRALWIIPLSLVIAFANKGKGNGKLNMPWFIAFFIISIVLAYYIPENLHINQTLSFLGKKGMLISLFLIGSGISLDSIKEVGIKSFAMGFLLWMIIGISSFVMLY